MVSNDQDNTGNLWKGNPVPRWALQLVLLPGDPFSLKGVFSECCCWSTIMHCEWRENETYSKRQQRKASLPTQCCQIIKLFGRAALGSNLLFYLVCFVRPSHLVLWSPNKVNIVTYSIAWWPDSSDFFRQINHRKQRHENINSIHGGCSWTFGRGVRQIGRHWLPIYLGFFREYLLGGSPAKWDPWIQTS